MGIPVCRIGDIVTGTCLGHDDPVSFTATWGSGSNVVTADGLGVVRVGDVGSTSCGHTIIAAAGSNVATADGIPVVRVGDPVTVSPGGSGICATGSNYVTAD